MLEKHQRATCTGTPSTCTGTPMQKRGSGQHVPVHLQHVPVHLCRKVAESNMYRYTTNMYRYTCVKTAGIEQAFDPTQGHTCQSTFNAGSHWRGVIKAIGYKEKGAFDS